MADTAGRPFDTTGLTVRGATKHATRLEPSTAVRARRFVASMAVDAADCRLLLDMLGLLPVAGAAVAEFDAEAAS